MKDLKISNEFRLANDVLRIVLTAHGGDLKQAAIFLQAVAFYAAVMSGKEDEVRGSMHEVATLCERLMDESLVVAEKLGYDVKAATGEGVPYFGTMSTKKM